MSKYELTFRRTKGSPVTSDEIDNNFKTIQDGLVTSDLRISTLELENQNFISDTTFTFEIDRLDNKIDFEVNRLDGRIDGIPIGSDYGDDDVEVYLGSKGVPLTVEARKIAFDNRFSGKSTDDLAEGTTNLYYTDAHWDNKMALANTDDLKEGETNLYCTDGRVQSVIDTNTAGFITDYTVTETDVTQHQASLSITESQISDLKDYLVTESLEYIDDKLQDHEDRIAVLEGNPVAPPIPYITVSALSSTADETVNRTITFIVNARNFKDTDKIFYNISGTNITASDIATPLSGTIRTGNGQTAFNVEVVRDRTTESPMEILTFNVTSDSTNEFFASPDPVSVTIVDSSFDSVLKTVGYVSGDWFTYTKNNVSSQWITNFDISSARLDNSDKVTLTQQVNNTISRGSLTSLGLTNSEIDTYISLLLDFFIAVQNASLDVSFPPGTDTVIYKDYKLSITGNDIGLRITGNDTLHPDLNLPHINNIETEGQVKVYVRGDRTHSGVEYTQTYTTTERQTLIDTMINAEPLWDSYPSSLQNFLLDIINVCIDYTATLPITIDLYNYEILRQNP